MKKIIPAALAALLLAGCSTSPEVPPASNPETRAETQFTEAASTAPAETQVTFPETQALPTETPGLSYAACQVAYNIMTAEGEEFGEFQGIDPEGNLLWTYVTPSYSMAQLSRITPIGLYQDRYYLIEDGTVVALDLLTGNVLFENPDFRGSPAPEAMLIDDFGYLYLSGYDSPLLFIMDPEGHTVRRITDYDTDYCMPFRLTMEGDTLTIHMESDGRGGSGDFPLEITADWLPQAVG